jgi:tetratricopeptide (TPR) repeat protein
MSTTPERPAPSTQPALPDLLATFLREQIAAGQAGLIPTQTGDVVPYDVSGTATVDPSLAWEGATAVLRYLAPQCDAAGWSVPPEWPILVASHEAVSALPFCLGNFPQLVRDLPALLRQTPLTAPSPSLQPALSAALQEWAQTASGQGRGPHPLLAAATLRLAGGYDQTAEVLRRYRPAREDPWAASWANETAALAWHRGEPDEARALWEKQPDSVPVWFNRGLAALVAGQRDQARACLSQAVEQLPEKDAWHHLGRVYLTLI